MEVNLSQHLKDAKNWGGVGREARHCKQDNKCKSSDMRINLLRLTSTSV